MGIAKDLVFPEDEFHARLGRVQAAMQQAGLELLLLHGPDNIYYLSGMDSVGYYQYQLLVLPREGRHLTLLCQRVETAIAHSMAWFDDIRTWAHGVDPVEMTRDIILEHGGEAATIGVEERSWFLRNHDYGRLRALLPRARFVDASALVPEIRLVKSVREIALHREAAALADACTRAGIEATREGVTETEVSAAVYQVLHLNGCQEPWLLMASGERTALLHGTATRRVIRRGDLVTFEPKALHKRYKSNILRTVSVGPPSDRAVEIHGILVEAMIKGTEAVKPGVPAGEIDRITRRITRKYDQYRLHRSGFDLGITYTPEQKTMSILDGSPHVLQAGMVFSLEPTIVLYDQGLGVILGHNVLVTETGHEVLNRLPMDLVVR
jgi:Xaa-Pro dipeptidase